MQKTGCQIGSIIMLICESLSYVTTQQQSECFLGLLTVTYIFVRFWGGGIGHKAMYNWNSFLCEDLGKAVDNEDKDLDRNDLEIEMGEPENEFEEDKRGAEKLEKLEERKGEEENGAITEAEAE